MYPMPPIFSKPLNKMKFKTFYKKLKNLFLNISEDYLGLIAAGVAFYFLMASFPALAAAISLYGIFSDPAFVEQQINDLSRFLPPEAVRIFTNRTQSLLATSGEALGLGFVIGFFLAIYSSAKGIGALIKGLNIAFNEKETRNFFRLAATGFVLTTGMLVYLLIALTLIAGIPAILNFIHIPDVSFEYYLLLRWPLLFCTAVLGLEILYSFAPCHSRLKWRWMSVGSVTATVIWLISSSFFSSFVTHFGKYNETYGSLSAIVILLVWFWMSAMTILLGAEINTVFSRGYKNKREDALNLAAGSEAQTDEIKSLN